MARRDRVTRLKSNRRKRNQNPKLSPFQREQKRARLANQAPTAKSLLNDNDLPKSQRDVLLYLIEKKKRDDAKRAERREEAERRRREANQATAAEDGELSAKSAKNASTESQKTSKQLKRARSASASEKDEEPETTRKARKVKMPEFTSLNKELQDSLGPARVAYKSASANRESADPSAPLTLEERIAKKKERKHLKKAAARKERIAEKRQEEEEELRSIIGSASKRGGRRKKGGDYDDEDNDAEYAKAARHSYGKEDEEHDASSNGKRRKSIQFNEAIGPAEEDLVHRAMMYPNDHRKPHEKASAVSAAGSKRLAADTKPARHVSVDDDVEDYWDEIGSTSADKDAPAGVVAAATTRVKTAAERRAAAEAKQAKKVEALRREVDFVRFGERVEAPPTFDVVPNMNAAITRLATQIEGAGAVKKRPAGAAVAAGAGADRFKLLSSVGGLGEQKRLSRMGLAPAMTATTVDAGRGAFPGGAEKKKQDEMELLRDKVMLAYQRSKRAQHTKDKSIDLKHKFPTLE